MLRPSSSTLSLLRGLSALLPKQYYCSSNYTTTTTTTTTTPTAKKVHRRVLSGIQPTGKPHLGNYLGAIKNWVRLQNEQEKSNQNENLYMIADLHALTLPQDPAVLRQEVFNATVNMLACGIDPAKSVVFRQSMVHQHAELSWVLCCLSPVGTLNRLAQWKTKLQVFKGMNNVTEVDASTGLALGLFSYPVLQAADILLYKSTHVPVGEDQIQHLQLTRALVDIFNRRYKTSLFPNPQAIMAPLKRVMSLKDASQKMSKSAPSDATRINLTDSPEVIRMKIRGAVTDAFGTIEHDSEKRPGMSNLIELYATMVDKDIGYVEAEFRGCRSAVTFKTALSDVIVEKLIPIQQEVGRLSKDVEYVEGVMAEGGEKAREIARLTMQEVYETIGLR